MIGPNLLIVGAPRAGTTFMWGNLGSHSDIFAPPVKEPHFHLADRWPLGGPEKEAFVGPLNSYMSGKIKKVWGGLLTSREAYSKLYEPGANYKWRLEATPNYFAEGREMALRISERLGQDIRIIVMLRDPVDRTLSHYRLFQKTGWETENFETAIKSTELRLMQGWAPTWNYVKYSQIDQPLREWREVFGKNLMTIAHSDLVLHPHKVLERVQIWLDLPLQTDMLSNELNSSKPLSGNQFPTAEAIIGKTNRINIDAERAALAKLVDNALKPPLVSIGMPVKNGAESIQQALESLSSQTYQNIEIVVCDNASEDNTCAIVEATASNDKRIVLKRFDDGVSIQNSYRRALESRRGDYFLFAPSDDRWDRRFIERAVQYLQRNLDAAVCCGDITMVAEDGTKTLSKGTVPIKGTTNKRWTNALISTCDASRIYGLLRNKNLDRIIPDKDPEGWDHYTTAKLAANGNIAKINVPAMLRDTTPVNAYRRLIEVQEPTAFGQLFFGCHVVRLFRDDPDIDTSGIKANIALSHFVLSHARGPESSKLEMLCLPIRQLALVLEMVSKFIR